MATDSHILGQILVVLRDILAELRAVGGLGPKCRCQLEIGDSPCPVHGMEEQDDG